MFIRRFNMNLVIVESPAKGKTIENYLGADFRVLSSYGHIRDLPTSKLGVEVEKNFEPQYIVPTKAKKNVNLLKNALKDAEKVYIATDYDREGEAIGFHLIEALNVKNYERITFTEITKDAIQNAVKNPRKLDMDLVNAQQARRVLDRLVGYKLSPFLWKKIFRGLSAGRVQSVAVRMIVEKEREIENFKPVEYWVVGAELSKTGEKEKTFEAKLTKVGETAIDKMSVKNEKEATDIASDLEKAKFQIESIEQKEINKYPMPPYTTSTLQQDASHKLYFSAKKTMKLAQDLYEKGLITYMRTDSVNLAESAIAQARQYIEKSFGQNYLPKDIRRFKTKSKGAQEAHEAVRPTDIGNDKIQMTNDKDHEKLYQLIRNRMLACQMKEAVIDELNIKIKAKNEKEYTLSARGAKIKFDGFLKVYSTGIKENELPKLTDKENLGLVKLQKEQKFTTPPNRFSEAALIKALEEKGIGRPSTYAPTISTIVDRGYVRLEQRVFYPQENGILVNDLLVENFPEIVDYDFTKHMEDDLDDIAEGKIDWVKVIREFYEPFIKNLKEKEKTVEKKEDEKTEKVCDKCGKPMVIKVGRFGKFIACSGFPECKTTKQLVNNVGMKCPDCQTGEVITRRTKKGKTFWGCSKYPECKWASWVNPMKETKDANSS